MDDPLQFTRREVNRSLLVAAFSALSAGRAMPGVLSLRSTPLFDFAIAGGYFHGLAASLGSIGAGVLLALCREPDNPHDCNAVAVYCADGTKLGYVPRVANEPLAQLLDTGAVIIAMLDITRAVDIPDELVFTSFVKGDPRIRLTVEDRPA